VYEQVLLSSGAVAWTSTGSSTTTLAADGCVDLILRDDIVVTAGPSTRWLTTTADVSTTPTVGLRFPPGTAAGALGTDLATVRDTAVALEQVVERPRALRLTTQMRELAVHLPDRDPRRLVELAPPARSPLWARLVLASAREGRPASQVRADLGWSESTLRRHVLTQFGYGYTALRRVERARRALALISAGASLNEVAARSGCADQPHMTRDFTDLVGTTPGHAARAA